MQHPEPTWSQQPKCKMAIVLMRFFFPSHDTLNRDGHELVRTDLLYMGMQAGKMKEGECICEKERPQK